MPAPAAVPSARRACCTCWTPPTKTPAGWPGRNSSTRHQDRQRRLSHQPAHGRIDCRLGQQPGARPESRSYFLNADGTAKARHAAAEPGSGATFQAIANGGVAAFYGGAIAQDIVDEIADTTGNITPGLTTLADLAAYRSVKREAVCTTYRKLWVCGMPPPSSGGLAVAQALGILENFDLSLHKPTALDDNGGKPTVFGVHLVAEAERLAYADRDKYVADTDFVPLPGGSTAAMLDKTYLRSRANLIDLTRSMGTAQPGNFGPTALGVHGPSPENGTTQITVVDGHGNVVSMTTTVESGFGAFHMTRGGFLLNNQLTDFSAAPTMPPATPSPTAWPPASGRAVRWRRPWCSARGQWRTRVNSAWPPAHPAARPSSST
jgi:gamma-glutamyltranspeptidase/glutathione hydrolase